MIRGGTLEVLVVGLLILEEEAIAAVVVAAAAIAVATVQAIAEGISITCLRFLGIPSIKIPFFFSVLNETFLCQTANLLRVNPHNGHQLNLQQNQFLALAPDLDPVLYQGMKC